VLGKTVARRSSCWTSASGSDTASPLKTIR
jgi:hypothetical protein